MPGDYSTETGKIDTLGLGIIQVWLPMIAPFGVIEVVTYGNPGGISVGR